MFVCLSSWWPMDEKYFLVSRLSSLSFRIETVRVFQAMVNGVLWKLGVNCVWNVMAPAQKPDFVFRRNGRVHLNRLLAAEVCPSALVMLDTPSSDVVWRVLATHSIRQFPPHFPSHASPCAITFQLDSTHVVLFAPRWCSQHALRWTKREGLPAHVILSSLYHRFPNSGPRTTIRGGLLYLF